MMHHSAHDYKGPLSICTATLRAWSELLHGGVRAGRFAPFKDWPLDSSFWQSQDVAPRLLMIQSPCCDRQIGHPTIMKMQ